MICDDILSQIRLYAKLKPSEESCGVICREGSSLKFLGCQNLSNYPEVHFRINPEVLIENNVVFIYHSHVNASSFPSPFDIKMYKQLCIPFLIYSLRDDDFYIYEK